MIRINPPSKWKAIQFLVSPFRKKKEEPMPEEMQKRYSSMYLTYFSFLYSGELDEYIEEDVKELLKEQVEAEKTKDLTKANQLRDKILKNKEVTLENTKNGIIWSRPSGNNKRVEFYINKE